MVIQLQQAPPIIFKDARIYEYLKNVEKLYQRIEEMFDYFGIRLPVMVYMADTLNEMEKLADKKIPSWVVGTHSNDKIIVLRYKLERIREIPMSKLIVHELVHILIRRTTRKGCPLVIDEGLAVYLSRQFMEILDIKKLIGRNTDLLKLNYNHPDFYQISYSYVYYLVKKIGVQKLICELQSCRKYYSNQVFLITKNERI